VILWCSAPGDMRYAICDTRYAMWGEAGSGSVVLSTGRYAVKGRGRRWSYGVQRAILWQEWPAGDIGIRR
jgi:hypothetical protein